jgi:hypothetical protein
VIARTTVARANCLNFISKPPVKQVFWDDLV